MVRRNEDTWLYPQPGQKSEHRLGSCPDLLQFPALPLTSCVSLSMLMSLGLDMLTCQMAAITEPPTC